MKWIVIFALMVSCQRTSTYKAEFIDAEIIPRPQPVRPQPQPLPAPTPRPQQFGTIFNCKNDADVLKVLKTFKSKKTQTCIYFYGESCPPCVRQTPIIVELAKKYKNIAFLKLDGRGCPTMVKRYNARVTPTILFKKQRVEGYMDQNNLEKVMQFELVNNTAGN